MLRRNPPDTADLRRGADTAELRRGRCPDRTIECIRGVRLGNWSLVVTIEKIVTASCVAPGERRGYNTMLHCCDEDPQITVVLDSCECCYDDCDYSAMATMTMT